jgi:hypothetical protein
MCVYIWKYKYLEHKWRQEKKWKEGKSCCEKIKLEMDNDMEKMNDYLRLKRNNENNRNNHKGILSALDTGI